jgi:hypothetical protein
MTDSALAFENLVDWLDGRLSPTAVRAVERALESADDETRAQVAWLRRFRTACEQTVLQSMPPALFEQLVTRFQTAFALAARPSMLRVAVATLTFDSAARPLAVGLRAAGQAVRSRQLVYTTELAEIALNIHDHRAHGHLDMSGQLFPEGDAPADPFTIQLLDGAEEVARTVTDELGEFAIDAVPAGAYHLLFSTSQVGILITPVTLGV